MFMSGNCHSKIKTNLRLLAGDSSLPCSCSGPSHSMLPAPMRFKLSYIPFHCFVVQFARTNEHLVQLSVDRLNSFPGSLSTGENPGNEVVLIDSLLKQQSTLVYLRNNTKNGCGAEVFPSVDCFLSCSQVMQCMVFYIKHLTEQIQSWSL